ncbi:polyamine aminopropyltransferase [Rhizobium vallis]|uniref:Polyamine aminopropyltransferase n=1 Tax=Rhizobium vallis TaxID=634290 RepID=A0A432PP53_9HYPH|nr:polyamine aminopropyltransferase [Rhizobium vallis]RUM25725.1 polyamine aminopropyltransferase [Rhizobium vallis]
MSEEAIQQPANGNRRQVAALIFSAFVSGLCSIIYELLIATTASYFLGDSVKFFSLTIGIYMASMGVGTYLSKFIDREILARFVAIELALAALGGLSIPILYFAYAWTGLFIHAYLFLTIGIGMLIGLEIPFLTRLMDRYNPLKVNIANILSFDYFGALVATIAFPFLLLPVFGVYQSSLLFGFANMSIGFVMLRVFGVEIGGSVGRLMRLTIVLTGLLAAMILLSHYFLKHWDQALYEDRIVHAEQTRFQRIVLTRDRDDLRLYLDGNLQFSSVDEYRYHEALVHVPVSLNHAVPQRVLLLGAGDGMAARELLKYPDLKEIVLVDLDPRMIALAENNPYVSALNGNSLRASKVKIVLADAFGFLQENTEPFDMVIADLPDPNNNALARLYSKQFYQLVRRNLTGGGLFVTQATSPYYAPRAFWSIAETVRAGGFANIYPYHVNVPSFGEWGFVLASDAKLNMAKPELAVETRFLQADSLIKHFQFDKDIAAENVSVSTLDRPVILDYYLAGWEHYR